jgi:predicted amidophosphoribosyltransferase
MKALFLQIEGIIRANRHLCGGCQKNFGKFCRECRAHVASASAWQLGDSHLGVRPKVRNLDRNLRHYVHTSDTGGYAKFVF